MKWVEVGIQCKNSRKCYVLAIILMILCCTISIPTSITCPDAVVIPNIQYSIKNIYNTTATNIIILQAILGPSGSIYYASIVGSSTAVFSKEDTAQNIIWAKSYDPHYFFQKGFVILPDEGTIFSIEDRSNNYIKILKINATDGSLLTRYQSSSWSTPGSNPTTQPFLVVTKGDPGCDSSSSTGCSLYFTVVDASRNAAICKFAVSGTTSSCAVVPSSNEVSSFLYVDSTHIFFTLRDRLTASQNPAFVFHQWGNTSPVWAKNRACSGISCGAMLQGAAILSPDGTGIYSLFSQEAFSYILLQVFSKSDGSIKGTRYNSINDGYQRGIDLQFYGTNLYCLVQSSYGELYIFDTVGNTWTHHFKFPTVQASLLQNNQQSLIYVYGNHGSNGHKIGFYIDYASEMSYVQVISAVMTETTSGYAMSDSSLVLQSLSTITFTTTTSAGAPETIQNVQYDINNDTSWETNLYSNVAELNLGEVKPEQTFEFNSGCTCTTTPARTNITYTIQQNGGDPIPEWINFDLTTAKYHGTAPLIETEQSYSFVLNSVWTTNPVGSSNQIVTITVKPDPPPPPEPEPEPEPDKVLTPDPEPAPTVYKEIPQEVSASNYGAVFAGGVSLTNSVISGNPPSGLYSILHQLQIVILFLMIDDFIPDNLLTYLEGQDFALMNFNFIPVKEIPAVDYSIEEFETDQPNEILQQLGIESGSTIVNNTSLITVLLCWILLHFFLAIIFDCDKKNKDRQNKFIRTWGVIRKWCLEVIKYSIYLRLFIEAHQTLLLSSCSEIHKRKLDEHYDQISYGVAWLVLIIACILPVLSFYSWIKYYNGYDPKKKFVFMEFFIGLKDTTRARLYMTMLTLRRIAYVLLVIFFLHLPRGTIYTIILSIQLLYLTMLLIIMPFDEQMSNFLEIVNETFLLAIISLLGIFKNEKKWEGSSETIFLQVIAVNIYIICVFMIANMIITICQKCRKKKKVTPEESQMILPNPPERSDYQISKQEVSENIDINVDEEIKEVETEQRMNNPSIKSIDQITGHRSCESHRIDTKQSNQGIEQIIKGIANKSI